MIRLDDVSYAYPDAPRPALERVNLEVERGSITGVVGASGAGKTTLAKVIAGFIPQVEGGELTGSATVDGRNLSELSLVEAVSQVGLVIQNPFNQISGARYTVRGEIAFGLENLGTPRDEMAARVDEVAALLRIMPEAVRQLPRAPAWWVTGPLVFTLLARLCPLGVAAHDIIAGRLPRRAPAEALGQFRDSSGLLIDWKSW